MEDDKVLLVIEKGSGDCSQYEIRIDSSEENIAEVIDAKIKSESGSRFALIIYDGMVIGFAVVSTSVNPRIGTSALYFGIKFAHGVHVFGTEKNREFLFERCESTNFNWIEIYKHNVNIEQSHRAWFKKIVDLIAFSDFFATKEKLPEIIKKILKRKERIQERKRRDREAVERLK